MIKGIIEKIIMNTFGKFVKGIEKQKLSVDLFSGNFKLENISLNHQFFNSLNSPITLAFSSIGKLNLQASLTKISSVPVECILDNIFVICQFRQNEKETITSFQAKKQKILREVSQVFQTALKKVKQDKKEDGMMARLGKKIIDNLQLKIMNVHVRFEEGNKHDRYAWGMTLEQISLTTTDNNWKPTFIERTNQASEKLFKMLQVKKLNIYWQSGKDGKLVLLKQKQHSNQQRSKQLSQMIKRTNEVVISITSEFKLTINPQQDTESPLYELNIGLQPIKFQLERLQMQQMMDFGRKNIMRNEMIVRTIAKKSKVKASEEEKKKLRDIYEQFIASNFDNQQQGNEQQFQNNILEQIFQKIDETELKIWALGPIKKKIKNIRQIQLKKKKSGWFSRGDNELTQQEQQQLQKYIQTSFEGEAPTRDQKYLFFRVSIELKGGRILLIQHKGMENQESIEFNIGRISCIISKSQDKSFFESFIEIASINLSIFLPIQKNYESKIKKLQIFTSEKPQDYKQQSDQDSMQSFDSAQEEQRPSFLKLSYKNQLLEEGTVLKRAIDGHIQRIIIIYKKLYMQKFKKFFTFKQAHTFVKGGNLDKFDSMPQQQQQQIQQNSFKLQKIMDVKLSINSPVFIAPLNENQCWCLNLGNLVINSNRNQDYEEYPMKITAAFLRYYPFMKECFDLKKKYVKQGVFSLIQDMNFDVNYRKIKKVKEQILSIQLPSFKVNFTQKQYENLISLQKIFSIQQSQKRSMIQILKQQRRIIEQNKSFEGMILKKHETLMSWKDYYGIISGQYLYLYNDKKQLKQGCKISIKNARILIKGNQQEGQQNNLQIQITNQNQICYLGCHHAQDLLKWKLQLQIKNREFKTIHELIKDNEYKESGSNKKRSGSDVLSQNDLLNKRKILKFKISQVQFRYQSMENHTLLEFQIFDIDFSRQNMREWSQKQFSMKCLKITDHLYKFTNTDYQTLIQAKGFEFKQNKGRKKTDQNRKAIININIKDIYINWKPDVILILIGLLNQHFKQQQKHRLDDEIQQSREQHFKQVYSDNKFMFMKENYSEKGKGIKVKENRDQFSIKSKFMKQTMKMNLLFDKLQINMIHRQSHMVMLKLISNQITCNLNICETAKFVQGTVFDLELYDMTGYPQKQYSPNANYPPYRILTKQVNNNNHLLEYRWSSYDSNSFPNEEKIDSFIWVQITPVEYEYYQQVTLRMIDYLLIQVTLLITQPQMLTVNQNLMEQLKKSKNVEEKPIKILFSQYKEIIMKLIHPFFMDMWFKLNDFSLILKAEKTSHIYYKVHMDELIFFNLTKKNSVRFSSQSSQQLKQLIYQDQYIVKGTSCHFFEVVQKRQKIQQLFQPFSIDLVLNKLILEDELNILYPEIEKYDRSFITLNNISEIIISHYSRLQYLNINKLVNFNFTFDDQNDELFIHNYKITKMLSPKPIFYEVIIPSIQMTADYNARQNTQQIWKLFKATINKFQMIFRRTKQLDSSMTFTLGNTIFLGYEYEQNKKEPIQHYLLSMTGQQNQKNSTQIVIENKTSGEKLIQMNVGDLKVNVRTGLLQLIFQYTLIEDWVFPTINSYVTDMIFYSTVQKMTADLCEDPRAIAEQLKKRNVGKKIINDLLSSAYDHGKFSLQGLLCYKFQRRKDYTTQQYEQKLQKNELDFNFFQKKDYVSSMNVILNTQIYRAWVKSPSKRKIIQKFTYMMEQKRYLRVSDIQNGKLKAVAKRIMNIDRGHLKVSFKDIILMQMILQQIGEQRKYIDYLNKQTGKIQQAVVSQKEVEASSLENLQLKIDVLSFYLINSRRDIFIPILKLNINNISITKANTFKKDILKGELSLTLLYFNNNIFRWQPILQKVSLGFHKLTYYQQNNSVFGSFETSDPIMINLSRQVFISINQTLAGWKKMQQEQENKYLYYQNQIEPLEFISHYTIRNQTGYIINIFNQKDLFINKVQHNAQIDYQLQIQNWDQNQDEIFIGVKIIHPKYQFRTIRNLSFSSEKQFEIHPKIMGSPNSIINMHSKIIIKPEVKDNKKVMMIKSSKYIYQYFDGACKVTPLPFDHDEYYILPREVHNSIKVSLYAEKTNDYYRYIGKDGILKIMKKTLIYNYSPIPLLICGKITRPNEYVGVSQSLKIQDVPAKQSILKVIKAEKHKEKLFQSYIFSQCYIVDYYGLSFDFGKEFNHLNKAYSHKVERNNFSYNIILLPDTQFKFKVSLQNTKSSIISLKTTIGKSMFTLQTNKSLCMFSMNSYLHHIKNSHISEFTRVIEITPQYMLSNATKMMVKICQADSCDSITLNRFERLPFFWESKSKPKFIKISAYDGEDFWGYSGNLSIIKSTETVILRKSSNPTMYRIFSIQIEVTNTVTFIHIIQSSPKYFLSNAIPGTILQVYQAAIMDEKLDLEYSFPTEFVFNVKYKQQKPFGYQLPQQSRKLVVKVELDEKRPQYKGLYCELIQFDDIQNNIDTKCIPVLNKKKEIVSRFYLKLGFQNNIKKLKLILKEEDVFSQHAYEFIVKCPEIGLSFIGLYNQGRKQKQREQSDKVRKQIIHLIFKNLEIQFTGNQEYSDMNLMVKGCRIQNQLKYNAIFPVLFESTQTKDAKYFINFKLSRSTKNSRLIQFIGCSINRSWLTITSEELQTIQENINDITNKYNKLSQIRQCQMFNSTIPDPQESIYFVQAIIHPLKTNVTFKHVNQWGGKLLKTFSSINQCPISAQGLKLEHFSCQGFKVFFDLLLKNYQDSVSKMILPMIGNLTIIGSPVTFVQKLGSGFKDFLELPAQGFVISPLEGGKGVLKGTGSLLSNAFSGAFNTVQSLTGSLGNGLSIFVDDHQSFARQRQNIKNDRSQHIIGGLANGAKSIANGFKNGVTGIFTQPTRGAEKAGLPGFLLGAVKGIGGLVLKPLSGVVDAASKTAEGIKNTPDFFSKQRENRFIREHNPRPFYNYYKQYRNYDKFLADFIKIFEQQKSDKFSNLSWCGYYALISEKARSKPILFLSYQYLIIYDLEKKQIKQYMHCKNIIEISLKQDEQSNPQMLLKVYDEKKKDTGTLNLRPDGGCRKLKSQINTIIRHYTPNFKFD